MEAEATILQYPLNKGQMKAFNALCAFLSFKQTANRFYRLSGYAGTGKTYLLKALYRHGRMGRSVMTGPTNKATKVIKRSLEADGFTVECKTIYALLGIRMVSDEDKLILEYPHVPADLGGYDVIFIDEASMLGSELLAYIKERAKFYRTKWVFLGDKAQIPPVGEKNSPIWKMDCPVSYLTKVERYDNQILELATHVREQVTSYPNVDLVVESNHSATEGVWKYSRERFIRNLELYAKRGEFLKPDTVVAVAWRNKTVNYLNDIIRRAMFGTEADNSRWLPGDRLSVGEPLTDQGKMVAHIEDEGTVVSSEVVHHSLYKELECYYLVVDMDDGPAVQMTAIHESSQGQLEYMLNRLAVEAKADRTKWKYFWMLKNSFHLVRHGYAKTGHRIQGSTYRDVFVDTSDILANSNSREALRVFYVAATRPTTKLILT